jgi:hypothetical protein
MGYNVIFTKSTPDIKNSIYNLYYSDLLNMTKNEFFDKTPSFENKNIGYFNTLLLKETLNYFIELEEYEKCYDLIKIKKLYKIKFIKNN